LEERAVGPVGFPMEQQRIMAGQRVSCGQLQPSVSGMSPGMRIGLGQGRNTSQRVGVRIMNIFEFVLLASLSNHILFYSG